jgi:hypothetical protein
MFAEDLGVFFNEDEFGVQATFTLPGSAGTSSFTVIFDDAFLNPETGLLSLETTKPQATCQLSDVDALTAAVAAANSGSPILPNQTVPLRGLAVAIEGAPAGETYSLLQVRPDGNGTATLVFARDS